MNNHSPSLTCISYILLTITVYLFICSSSSVVAGVTQPEADSITKVHVIFANHLDIGFDGINPTLGYAVNVINRYFQVYFPQAVEIANQMRAKNMRYIYTTHAWLVSLYLDCTSISLFPSPPTLKLSCPSATDVKKFIDCIATGDITWHAFPFNMQLAFMDSSFIGVAVDLVHQLDTRFNKTLKHTLSQRDVPGLTIGAIDSLNQAGINAVSVGVNGGSAPPDVPKIFMWKNPVTGAEVLAMWHPGGYGDIYPSDCVTIPGFSEALAFAWRGDNGGPGDIDYVTGVFTKISQEYPNAQVVASTFDDFVAKALPMAPSLPVITSEIGDSWMYGVPSDPWKVQMWREIMRIHRKFQSDKKKLIATDYTQFYRLLLKVPEHTWGMDVKTFLNDTTNWANVDFQAHRNDVNFLNIQASWDEQRQYIYDAIKVLGTDPLAQEITTSLNKLRVTGTSPSLTGYNLVTHWKTSTKFTCGEWITAFGNSGGISYLENTITNKLWADDGHVLGEYVYTTFDSKDYTNFTADYCYCSPPTCSKWIPLDFGKPDVDVAKPVRGEWRATTNAVYSYEDTHTCSYYLYTPFYRVLHTDYGAPQSVWTQINITKSATQLNMNFYVYDKTPTRLPESHWILFNPITDESLNGLWWVDKCGQLVNPLDVVVNGSMHIHGQMDGILYKGNDGSLLLSGLDVSVVSFGSASSSTGPNPFPTPFVIGKPQEGIYFNVFNNIWGTNYVMWYPWRDEDANMLYRFQLVLQ